MPKGKTFTDPNEVLSLLHENQRVVVGKKRDGQYIVHGNPVERRDAKGNNDIILLKAGAEGWYGEGNVYVLPGDILPL